MLAHSHCCSSGGGGVHPPRAHMLRRLPPRRPYLLRGSCRPACAAWRHRLQRCLRSVALLAARLPARCGAIGRLGAPSHTQLLLWRRRVTCAAWRLRLLACATTRVAAALAAGILSALTSAASLPPCLLRCSVQRCLRSVAAAAACVCHRSRRGGGASSACSHASSAASLPPYLLRCSMQRCFN